MKMNFPNIERKVQNAPWNYAMMWPCELLGDFG